MHAHRHAHTHAQVHAYTPAHTMCTFTYSDTHTYINKYLKKITSEALSVLTYGEIPSPARQMLGRLPLLCSCFLWMKTLIPVERRETSKIRKWTASPSRDAPEVYKVHSTLPQGHINSNICWNRESLINQATCNLCRELQGCSFCESPLILGWVFWVHSCLWATHAPAIQPSSMLP